VLRAGVEGECGGLGGVMSGVDLDGAVDAQYIASSVAGA
jgi:hypothetical protein